MLTSFRKQKAVLKFALWFVIIAFVVTIFLVWGVGDNVANANFLMKINGKTVSYEEYSNTLENTRNYMRSIFGDNFDSLAQDGELEKQVIEDLTNKYLLIQKAEENGITVSDDEVLAVITSIPSFQVDGKFNKDAYQTILARSRMTPQQFEASVKTDRLAEKMRELVAASVSVNDEEVAKEYSYRNKKASVSYITFSAENFAHEIKAEEAALKEYYTANTESYRIPKRIKVLYTYFDPASFTPASVVSDQDAESYYVRNQDQFNSPEAVHARHILIRVEDWHNDEAVKAALAKSESILNEIKGGLDFAEAAKKYSADSSAANGGDLGFFTKGQMVPEFEQAAFALNSGEVSGVVKTMYGYHIIKAEEKQEARKPTLDEVKEDIKKLLTEQSGEAEFREYVFGRYTAVVKAANITAYNSTAETQLPVRETGFFSEADMVEPVSANPDVMAKLFRLSKSEVSQVETINGVSYIFEIADVQESRIPEFEEVRAAVEADYIRVEAVKLASAKADEAMKEADIKAAADKLGTTFTTTPQFMRSQQVPGIGMNLELNDMIFAAGTGKFTARPFVNGSSVYAVYVNEVAEPSMDELKDYADMIRNELLMTKSDEALKAYLAEAKAKAKIEISPFYENLFK
ncbi:MAG: SurA N-terminal domain-containing protein [Deferribacterales bacterium]